MKKVLAVLLGTFVIAAPLAEAQAQSHRNEPPRKEWRDDRRQPAPKKPVVRSWKRGETLRSGVARHRLDPREVRRYRLPEPRRGQMWVQVGGQFLLLNTNGFIVSIAAR
ncbi:RcnB family protein [Rhizobiaceae bacterium BDR2-2]|uniref:RcnB family protein n=1 Tax=Ectorhizobium quercum TaxID=2965071 RepID=A0AAE3N5T1_9HYPH|nr:RcnB family protein [Ectorhizobium quercum]MCX8999795.1 RcnB family protein [Ectorhizobium quercum]